MNRSSTDVGAEGVTDWMLEAKVDLSEPDLVEGPLVDLLRITV